MGLLLDLLHHLPDATALARYAQQLAIVFS